MNAYANRVVSKDELVLLNAGEYEEVYVAGLFRAEAELDFDALAARYIAGIPHARPGFDAPDLPPVAFGNDPRTSDPIERGFIAWLGDEGLITRIPTVDVRLSAGFAADGGMPMLDAKVEDAELVSVPDGPRP